MYDISGGPPRSVEIQRILEAHYERARAVVEEHFGVILVLGAVAYLVLASDPSDVLSARSVAPEITTSDVVIGAAVVAALGVVSLVVITLHELCHWYAFRRFGVDAEWTITWISLPVIGKAYPAGGLCWSTSVYDSLHLSWAEDAVVSLAPLVLVAIGWLAAGAYHVFADPFTSPFWVAVGVLVVVGPSPPDYLCLTETPRHRWERLCDYADRVDNHAAAEGWT